MRTGRLPAALAALLLLAAAVYGGSFAVRAYLRAFKGARTGKRSS